MAEASDRGEPLHAGLIALYDRGAWKGVLIEGYSTGTLAKNLLKVGDALVSINGHSTDTIAKLTAVLQSATPGSDATVVVNRAGSTQTVSVPLIAAPAGGGAQPQGSGLAVSLADARALPQNKGKSDAQITADIKSHGHEVRP